MRLKRAFDGPEDQTGEQMRVAGENDLSGKTIVARLLSSAGKLAVKAAADRCFFDTHRVTVRALDDEVITIAADIRNGEHGLLLSDLVVRLWNYRGVA